MFGLYNGHFCESTTTNSSDISKRIFEGLWTLQVEISVAEYVTATIFYKLSGIIWK